MSYRGGGDLHQPDESSKKVFETNEFIFQASIFRSVFVSFRECIYEAYAWKFKSEIGGT